MGSIAGLIKICDADAQIFFWKDPERKRYRIESGDLSSSDLLPESKTVSAFYDVLVSATVLTCSSQPLKLYVYMEA